MGRLPTGFTTATDRTNRRRTEECGATIDISELMYPIQISLHLSGSKDADSVVKDVNFASPSRALKYKSALKFTEIPYPAGMSGDAALSFLFETKLTKQEYKVMKNTARENHSHFLPSYNEV